MVVSHTQNTFGTAHSGRIAVDVRISMVSMHKALLLSMVDSFSDVLGKWTEVLIESLLIYLTVIWH